MSEVVVEFMAKLKNETQVPGGPPPKRKYTPESKAQQTLKQVFEDTAVNTASLVPPTPAVGQTTPTKDGSKGI